jgi:transglutaminase-like putative cysteine protease
MTAVSGGGAQAPNLAGARRLPLAPAEGWLTLAFVALMALTVAWSFDDAAWVLGRGDWGDFYTWAALLATLIGFGGAKAGWPRWVVHLVGATAAALVLPLMVGGVLLPDGGSPGELYRATATSAVNAWIDLGVLNRSVTTEYGHYLLTIGVICWSVGQFAGYAVFGHRRPLDAVLVVGIVLLANMAMTANDQLGYLVVFTIAALCVLARSHAFDEETTWVRRRIGDASAVRSLYLRGGAVFIVTAIFGSLVLTASASSAPLSGMWHGVDRTLIDLGREIQRLLPVGGNSRPVGFGFGDRAAITGIWESSDQLALTIQLPIGDKERHYWRAVTFDRYEPGAWAWTDPTELDRPAQQGVFDGLADAPTNAFARREVAFEVRTEAAVGDFVFSPLDPLTVSEPTTVRVVGSQGWFSALETDATSYTVTSAVPVLGEEGNGLTANRLRAAGTDYPEEIRRLYLQLPEGYTLGPEARDLLAEFQAAAGVRPYDLATAMEERFSASSEFQYDADIRGLCGSLNTVDCFAVHKRGYCMQYATTMAVLLREAGVPARLALGYLPGDRDFVSGIEEVRASGAHAWVEVWFPGFGWYPFDPTGGGRSQTPALADGPVVSAPPSVAVPIGTIRPGGDDGGAINPGDRPPSDPAGPATGGSNPAILVAVAVLLLIGVGGLAFVAWQRGPRGDVTPDGVWRGIARTAGRLGFGPRPQQTVYEYAGSLGEVLPAIRPELQTVARAKVEVAYGRRELGGDALRGLRDAQRRLRLGLLRLAFRRGARTRFRR